MSDNKITISASASRKLNHAVYGGEQYESSDVWESESVEISILSEKDLELVEDYRRKVREEVNRRLDEAVAIEIARIKGLTKCKNPNCKETASKGFDYCFMCGKALKEGARFITPEEKAERDKPLKTTPNGAPDFDKSN